MFQNTPQSLLEKLFEVAALTKEEKDAFSKKYEYVLAVEALASIAEELDGKQKEEIRTKIESLKDSPEELGHYLRNLIKTNPRFEAKVQKATENVFEKFIRSFLECASEQQKDTVEDWLKQRIQKTP